MSETSILDDLPRVREEAVDANDLDALLATATTPFVVRGLARDWPLVEAGKRSQRAARAYLLERARPCQFSVNIGAPAAGDRLFYDDRMNMNFREGKSDLANIFRGFDDNEGRAGAPIIYLSSVDMRDFFHGLFEANHVDLGTRDATARIWIGNRTRIAPHNDVPDNLAVCAVGRRRFTLFPPEQFVNLYLGPIDNTPAGRQVSMVDLRAPDFDRHPRFRDALSEAQVAELEPGDAVFIPSQWWHHVEGLDEFNVLVNFWWTDSARFLGQPEDALIHAVLAIRDLPPDKRDWWRKLFDHYVFAPNPDQFAHLPEGKRGILDPLTAESAGRLRAFLLRSLSG